MFSKFKANNEDILKSSIIDLVSKVSLAGGYLFEDYLGKNLLSTKEPSHTYGYGYDEGYKTAVLDADITGPSIPKAFGITERALGSEEGILPRVTEKGVKVMSVNLLLENDTDPVVWRGPVIAGTVKQFWTDVVWGDVDYMFVDMPPGTGDVPLTVFQSLPIKGIIIVTSPQDLVSMIVSKAVKMANLMNIPVLALVENYSYFECPDCKSKHFIYGEGKSEEIAKEYGIPTVAHIPVYKPLAEAEDAGKIEDYNGNWLDEITAMLEK
jgi:Mrp family chromosome partitioning ATPase